MLSLADALAQVQAQCAPTTDPVLSLQEITDILTRQSTTTTWAANTAYSYGAFVIPTIPQGRLYRCTLAGTSDPTTEPIWLMAPAWYPPPSFFAGWVWGVSVSPFLNSPWIYGLKDGTLAWCDWGPFAGELYDVRAACYSAWMLKADKATDRVDVTISGAVGAKEATTYDRCVDRARRFAPLGFA